MRNRIFGGIGVLWGGGILVSLFLKQGTQGEGTYAAGQTGAMILGGLMFILGFYYLIRKPKGSGGSENRK